MSVRTCLQHFLLVPCIASQFSVGEKVQRRKEQGAIKGVAYLLDFGHSDNKVQKVSLFVV